MNLNKKITYAVIGAIIFLLAVGLWVPVVSGLVGGTGNLLAFLVPVAVVFIIVFAFLAVVAVAVTCVVYNHFQDQINRYDQK